MRRRDAVTAAAQGCRGASSRHEFGRKQKRAQDSSPIRPIRPRAASERLSWPQAQPCAVQL
eukprot:11616498-Heterocapsa_arctica.AAC.1